MGDKEEEQERKGERMEEEEEREEEERENRSWKEKDWISVVLFKITQQRKIK